MKKILTILFLPFRVLAGNQVSGILFNVFRKYPWLNIVFALMIAVALIVFFPRG